MELSKSKWIAAHIFLAFILLQFQNCGSPFESVTFDHIDLAQKGPPGSCSVEKGTETIIVKDGETYLFYSEAVSDNCAGISVSRVCSNGKFLGDTTFSHSDCLPPKDPGDKPKLNGIAIDPKHPNYWLYDGVPILLIGANADPRGNQLQHKTPAQLDHIFDLLTGAGGNLNRTNLAHYVQDINDAIYPFRKIGGKYDLTKFNDAYFAELDVLFKKASQKKIVIQLEFFDRHNLGDGDPGDTKWWPNSPWNPRNNSSYSGVSLPTSDQFLSATSTQVRNAQKGFMDKVLETAKPYKNIIFQLANESSSSLAWSEHMAAYLKGSAPAKLGRPILLTDLRDNKDLRSDDNDRVRANANYSFFDMAQVLREPDNLDLEFSNILAYMRLVNKKKPVNRTKVYNHTGRNTSSPTSLVLGVDRFITSILAGAASVNHHKPNSGSGIMSEEPITSNGNRISLNSIKAARWLDKTVNLRTMNPVAVNSSKWSNRSRNEAFAMESSDAIVFYFPKNNQVGFDTRGLGNQFKEHWIEVGTGKVGQGGVSSTGANTSVDTGSAGSLIIVLKRE